MLDTLNMTGGPLKVLSQSWLVHAMTRGDVGRIMEPLFLTLLDPCTARVSVLHCSLDMLEEEVFAIAFDQGNQDVIFHVINNGDKSTSLRQYRYGNLLVLTIINRWQSSESQLIWIFLKPRW